MTSPLDTESSRCKFERLLEAAKWDDNEEEPSSAFQRLCFQMQTAILETSGKTIAVPGISSNRNGWFERSMCLFEAILPILLYKRDAENLVLSNTELRSSFQFEIVRGFYLSAKKVSASTIDKEWPPAFLKLKDYWEFFDRSSLKAMKDKHDFFAEIIDVALYEIDSKNLLRESELLKNCDQEAGEMNSKENMEKMTSEEKHAWERKKFMLLLERARSDDDAENPESPLHLLLDQVKTTAPESGTRHGETWRDAGIILLKAVLRAILYERETNNTPVSISKIQNNLHFAGIEELYQAGLSTENTENQEWLPAFVELKNYWDRLRKFETPAQMKAIHNYRMDVIHRALHKISTFTIPVAEELPQLDTRTLTRRIADEMASTNIFPGADSIRKAISERTKGHVNPSMSTVQDELKKWQADTFWPTYNILEGVQPPSPVPAEIQRLYKAGFQAIVMEALTIAKTQWEAEREEFTSAIDKYKVQQNNDQVAIQGKDGLISSLKQHSRDMQHKLETAENLANEDRQKLQTQIAGFMKHIENLEKQLQTAHEVKMQLTGEIAEIRISEREQAATAIASYREESRRVMLELDQERQIIKSLTTDATKLHAQLASERERAVKAEAQNSMHAQLLDAEKAKTAALQERMARSQSPAPLTSEKQGVPTRSQRKIQIATTKRNVSLRKNRNT